MFYYLNKLGSLHQGFKCSRIQPGEAAAEALHVEPVLLQVEQVEVGDLEFAARARFELNGQIADVRAVEIEAWDGEGAARLLWFLLDGDGVAVLVNFHDSIPLGVAHPVAEDSCAIGD